MRVVDRSCDRGRHKAPLRLEEKDGMMPRRDDEREGRWRDERQEKKMERFCSHTIVSVSSLSFRSFLLSRSSPCLVLAPLQGALWRPQSQDQSIARACARENARQSSN